MILDFVRTPRDGGVELEIRHPMLWDFLGPGYRVMFRHTFASHQAIEDARMEIKLAIQSGHLAELQEEFRRRDGQ